MAKKQNNLLEYKDLDAKALREKVVSSKKELQDLIIDKNMSKLSDLKSISKKKKEVARMLTIINQKELLVRLEQSSKEGEK